MSEALKKETSDTERDDLRDAIHDLEEVIVLARTTVDVVNAGPEKINLACTMSSGVLRKLTLLKDKLDKCRIAGGKSR